MVDDIFTPRQQEYLMAPDARINILQGAVRSGKSYISLFKYAMRIRYSPMDSVYMFTALTTTTLKRNVLEPLLSQVGEDNLSWSTGNKDGWLFGHHILLESSPDERAEQKIRGLTLDGVYCDELTLYKKSFFAMLLSRLSRPHATLYGTTNPDNPNHWLKADYIDRADSLDLKSWFFRIEDNTFLDKAYIEALKKEYTGVFYKRFILGEWVLADGLVYSSYDEASMMIPDPTPEELRRNYGERFISCDYGIENPTAFCMFAWHTQRREWHMIADWAYGGRDNLIPKSDPELYQELVNFSAKAEGNIERVVIDPSASSFIVLIRQNRRFRVLEADNEVLAGISFTNTMFAQGKLRICRGCTNTRKELYAYSWDTEKSRELGKDCVIKQNDHNMDAMRYFCNTVVKPKARLYGVIYVSENGSKGADR